MTKVSSDESAPKKSHAFRKLVGAVAIAGATFAVEKIVASKKKKKAAK